MSYNITSWKTKVLIDLKIPVESLYKHQRTDWHPQAEELEGALHKFHVASEGSYIMGDVVDGMINVADIHLCDEGSGIAWDWIIKPALKDSKGKLIAIRIWEGGDSIDKLTVLDGVITEEEIEL